MNVETTIRAWKDPSFRNTLSAQAGAELPAMPAGLIELEASDLEQFSGGRTCPLSIALGCTTTFITCCDCEKDY